MSVQIELTDEQVAQVVAGDEAPADLDYDDNGCSYILTAGCFAFFKFVEARKRFLAMATEELRKAADFLPCLIGLELPGRNYEADDIDRLRWSYAKGWKYFAHGSKARYGFRFVPLLVTGTDDYYSADHDAFEVVSIGSPKEANALRHNPDAQAAYVNGIGLDRFLAGADGIIATAPESAEYYFRNQQWLADRS